MALDSLYHAIGRDISNCLSLYRRAHSLLLKARVHNLLTCRGECVNPNPPPFKVGVGFRVEGSVFRVRV